MGQLPPTLDLIKTHFLHLAAPKKICALDGFCHREINPLFVDAYCSRA